MPGSSRLLADSDLTWAVLQSSNTAVPCQRSIPKTGSTTGSITPPRAQAPPRRVEGKEGAGVVRSAPVQAGLTPSPDHVWCGVTYAPLELPAGHEEEVVVLQVAVFRPGVYVLDDYVVEWACVAQSGVGGRSLKGNKLGTPYVLRVEAA